MKKSVPLAARIGALLCILVFSASAFAHSPHDVIFDIAISPGFSADKTIFIITGNSLMVSTDEGQSWKKLANGLDNAGQLVSLAISPAFERDGVLLAASDQDGIYRSEDKGKSWARANSGLNDLNIRSIELSPYFLENGTVLVLDESGQLFKSTDRGRTWMPLPNAPKDRISYHLYLPLSEGERLVAGTRGGDVLMADENTNQWEKVASISGCGSISAAAASPFSEKDGRIWVGCENSGVFEVTVRDKFVESRNQGLSDQSITSLSAVTNVEGEIVLYASSRDEGLFRLKSAQEVWEKRSDGLTTDPQAKDPRYMMPNFKGIAAAEATLFLGGFDGLFTSSNGGDYWEQLDTISPSGLTGLAVHAHADATSHEVALATYGAGAYLYNSSNDDWSILNRGLKWTRLTDILFSPDYSRSGLIFSGAQNDFYRYEAKYGTWQAVPVSTSIQQRLTRAISRYLGSLGLTATWIEKISKPASSDSRHVSAIQTSANFSDSLTLYFGTRSSGLYSSTDSGLTNSPLWGANATRVTALGLSSWDSSVTEVLFAGVYDQGVFKTTDGGGSWRKTGSGLSVKQDVHLGISPDFTKDRTIVAGSAAGLFISTDAGETWTSAGVTEFGASPMILCVAFSPLYKEDRTILVGIKGRGVWRTMDAGAHFAPFSEELIQNNYDAKFIRYSPNFKDDGTIYYGSNFALFQSVDRGRSWRMLAYPVRYENFREELRYEGNWLTVSDNRYSALSAAYSVESGSKMKLRFTGSGFRWIGDRSPEHGSARVLLDGAEVAQVSQKSEAAERSVEIFALSGLEYQSHELVIEVFCPDVSAGCGAVSVDAVDAMSVQAQDPVVRR